MTQKANKNASRTNGALFRSSLAALVLCLGASAAAAQTVTPCVQKPFQAISHIDVTIADGSVAAHGTVSIQLPNTASKIQQISLRIAGAPIGGFVLRNLTVTIQLDNVQIDHGVEVPNSPFLLSDFFASTLSRQVTFYADAGSVVVFDADFTAGFPHATRGVDISIVGLTRSAGCTIIQ